MGRFIASQREMLHLCGCPIIGSPLRKVFSGRQFAVKNSPGRGRFLPVNCWPGKLFWGEAIL